KTQPGTAWCGWYGATDASGAAQFWWRVGGTSEAWSDCSDCSDSSDSSDSSPKTPACFAASTFFSCLVKLRRMNTTATISAIITAKPTHPATTLLSSGLGSEASARATTVVMTPLSQVGPVSASADPGEEVVLGDRGLDVAGHQLEVLGRPGQHLQLARHGEPRPVRVDLGRVRQQRLVADP